MSEQDPESSRLASLRQKAEAHFREHEELSPENLAGLSAEDMRSILHELRVHQIELEMQNGELHAAQADLAASRARYFELYDLAPVGYVTLGEPGLILEANLTAANLLGLARQALVKRPISRVIFKADQDIFYRMQKQLVETGQAQQCELRMVTPDGSTFWAQLSATAARNEEGATAFRIALSDVSGSKAAQEKIRASEERFAQTLVAVNDGLWDWNVPTGNAFFSANFYSLLGYDDGEFPANYTSWRALVHPDDLGRVEADLRRSIETGTSFTIDLRMKLKSGKWGWVSTRGNVTERDAQGGILRMMGTLSDIAGRKRAEEQMLNLRTAVEQSASTVVITDTRGNIEYVNPAFEKSTGYTAAEAAGKNPRILKSDEQDAEFYRHLWATITSGKIWRGEFHNTRKDGSLYWEAATISPVLNDKGDTVRYLAIKEDITGRKAIEASLATALQRAEAANRAKSEFLNVMSHELRTPLNGVLGFAQLLSDSLLDSEQKDYAATISSSGEHLLAIINDILDFASIDAGALAIHVAPLAVADLVKTAEDTVLKIAAEKGIEVRCELAAGVPEQIIGDAQRLRQILINLLGNAVKFTASGSVVLRVARSGKLLEFSVKDTGIGISSETLARLFQPFVQADSKMSRPFGGAGLGLSISKRLAEAMGGAITVASTPGKGSTFTFRLPLEVSAGGTAAVPSHLFPGADGASPSSPGAETPAPPDAPLVLVVDDDQASSVIAGKMLQRLGYRTEFAGDGTGALKTFVPGKFFAIFMDVSMPVMGGLEATKKIRGRESGSRVPIIALTANVMPGDRERCLAAGMDDFLSKPFKRAELSRSLEKRVK